VELLRNRASYRGSIAQSWPTSLTASGRTRKSHAPCTLFAVRGCNPVTRSTPHSPGRVSVDSSPVRSSEPPSLGAGLFCHEERERCRETIERRRFGSRGPTACLPGPIPLVLQFFLNQVGRITSAPRSGKPSANSQERQARRHARRRRNISRKCPKDCHDRVLGLVTLWIWLLFQYFKRFSNCTLFLDGGGSTPLSFFDAIPKSKRKKAGRATAVQRLNARYCVVHTWHGERRGVPYDRSHCAG